MKRLITATALALTLALSSYGYAWTISGTFGLPFDPNQRWKYSDGSDCSLVGLWNDSPDHGQIFMQWYAGKGYHMAEDWNGKCGASTDKYGPLYAIGDGFIVDVQDPGNNYDGFGKSLTVRYTLPDGLRIDSVYDHVQDIYVSMGMNVQKGDKIATIGDGNGQYLNAAHLHWEIRKNVNIKWNAPSYVNSPTYPHSIEIATALDYTSPSLFIDDRQVSDVHGLSANNWTYFTMGFNAPSSTSYVEYNNGRYSLKRAVDNGLIWQSVWVQISGAWYYYPDITKVLFETGKTYAVYGFVPNANLFILIPGHNYKADRAKIDMIRTVSVNSNFKSVKPDTFTVYTSDQSFDYWYMQFIYNNGSGNQPAYVYQATLKSNPIVRYTIYYDPATASWTPWTSVDPNMLY